MEINSFDDQNLREEIVDLLKGGFAPVVTLLREFHFDKAGIVLEGMHFSAFSLLGHMIHRQRNLLNFIKEPGKNPNVWPQPLWPQDFKPENEVKWEQAISEFENDLSEIIRIVINQATLLYEKQENGKSILWAAMANLQHNAYHIGQIKAIGRQLGVW